MFSRFSSAAALRKKIPFEAGFCGALLGSLALGCLLVSCVGNPAPPVATESPPVATLLVGEAVTQVPATDEPTPTRKAARPRKKTPSPSATAVATERLTPTASPLPLDSPLVTDTPAALLSPTPQPASPTVACLQAAAGNPLDITIPADTQVQPRQAFTKVWRLRNAGSCTWTADFTLGWFSGDNLGAPSMIPLGQVVRPGESIDISVPMVAPEKAGAYQSDWQLISAGGEVFALGTPGTAISAHVVVVAGPTATIAASPTASPVPLGAIGGRVLLDGSPVGAGVAVRLEDQAYQLIASAVSGADGTYRFADLQPTTVGYNLAFSQADNPGYTEEQVASWAWIGPVTVAPGAEVQLPDFEIGVSGFAQVAPEPEATVSAGAISPGAPLLFAWTPYPGATSYWIDLTLGDDQALVWQTGLVADTSVSFDGTLIDGTHLPSGEYWWAVGARLPVGDYTQTVYSYLANLVVEP